MGQEAETEPDIVPTLNEQYRTYGVVGSIIHSGLDPRGSNVPCYIVIPPAVLSCRINPGYIMTSTVRPNEQYTSACGTSRVEAQKSGNIRHQEVT
jgi:hypothetical protein